jgi:Domain of unknown function (DUF6894)
MARYFFHVSNGQHLPDGNGMMFPGVSEARQEAMRTASDLLRGDGEDIWNSPDWTMCVTTEAGSPVFTIRIVMDDHGVPSTI